LGELHHQRLVGFGDAVDIHDHPEGKGLGNVAGEVTLTAEIPHLLHEQIGQRLDARLTVLDRRRFEPPVGHQAVVPVLLAVQVDQRARNRHAGIEHPAPFLLWREHRSGCVGPPVVLARDVEHVGVSG